MAAANLLAVSIAVRYRPSALIVYKVTALLIALLIGNPMCCCAMSGLFAKDNQDEQKPTPRIHSCCSHSVEFCEEEEEPERPDSCPCFLEKERFLPASETFSPPSEIGDEVTKTPQQGGSSFLLPHLSPVVSNLKKWPPGCLPIPPTGGRLALNCCYLL